MARMVVSINNFNGADFSSPALLVSNDHATDILNFIKKDNINQKRPGYSQIGKATQVDFNRLVDNDGTSVIATEHNTTEINGLWNFIAENKKSYTVAHIGRLLFLVYGLGEGKSFLDCSFIPLVHNTTVNGTAFVEAITLLNQPTVAFAGANRLYILGGNKYFMLRIYDGTSANQIQWELVELEDSEYTYVPVTTIGITYADSTVIARTVLDDVNLLTQWRKNKSISGTYIDDGVTNRTTRFWVYELDTNINLKKATDINDIECVVSYLDKVVTE